MHAKAADEGLRVVQLDAVSLPMVLQGSRCHTLASASSDRHLPHVQESSLLYNIRMKNGSCAHLHVYCVYEHEVTDIAQHTAKQKEFEWECVTRGKCSHGCQGPVLMPMQRFGRHLGGRKGEVKTPSSLHISVDEASNHVGVRGFR